jgi:hypothetical protein
MESIFGCCLSRQKSKYNYENNEEEKKEIVNKDQYLEDFIEIGTKITLK